MIASWDGSGRTAVTARRPNALRSLRPVRGAVASLLVAAALSIAAGPAAAMDVGTLHVTVPTGGAPYAELDVDPGAAFDAGSLKARIASAQAYSVAGLAWRPELGRIEIKPVKGPDGRTRLRVAPLPAAIGQFDLLIVLSDRARVSLAEYRVDLRSGAREFAPTLAGARAGDAGGKVAAAAVAVASPSASPAPAAPAAAPVAAPAAPAPVAQSPAQSPAPAPSPAPTKPAPATPTPNSPAQTKPAAPAAAPAAVKPASPAPAATPAPAPAPAPVMPPAAATQEADVQSAVRAWADAWTRKDVPAYVAAYVPDFRGRGARTNEAWQAQRRERLLARKSLSVQAEDIQVTTTGDDRAVARFVQVYAGDDLRQRTRKELVLVRRDGRWLIAEER